MTFSDVEDIAVKVALKLAESLAELAENSAEQWKDKPGDVALRAFAETIRQINKR